MTDITERLRDIPRANMNIGELAHDAADEIDRLRARLNTAGHAHLDGAHLSGKVDGCLLCEAMTERETLRARVAELEAARGEPGVWLRDQRGSYEGPETLDPMFYLGAADPGRGAHGATYSPFYPAPPVQARGEPVAWIGSTALDALDEQRRSREPGYVLVEVCDSESADYEIALYTAPLAPTVDVNAISEHRLRCGAHSIYKATEYAPTPEEMRAALRAIFNKGE